MSDCCYLIVGVREECVCSCVHVSGRLQQQTRCLGDRRRQRLAHHLRTAK